MEGGLFLALAGVGYLVNRMASRTSSSQGGGPTPDHPAPVLSPVSRAEALGDRPSARTTYESAYVDAVRAEEALRAARMTQLAHDPASSGVVSRNDRHPGMAIKSSLSGITVPVEEFTHNNMVPFYRGSPKQAVQDDAFQGRLEAFTGSDSVGPARKTERETLFSPEPQNIFGASSDDVRSAFMASIPQPRNMAHAQPAPEQVRRPGPVGGAWMDTRDTVRYKTVDDLRVASNPKSTYEGRVLPGAGVTPERFEPAPMPNLRPTLLRERSHGDLLRTTGAVLAERGRPQQLVRDTVRQATSREYVGAAGVAVSAAQDRNSAARGANKAVLQAPQPGPAAAGVKGVTDYGKASIAVYANGRDVTTTRTYQGNLATAVKALIAPVQDLFRGTRKEEYLEAPREFGNIAPGTSVQPKLTVYDTGDVLRTTIKQTLLSEATAANLRGGALRATVYDPDDVARTTAKQTLLSEATAANLRGGALRTTVYDPDDVARTTAKQTLLSEATAANLRGGALRTTVYDPDDVARTTARQTLLSEAAAANLRGGALRATVYDPDDVARTTARQTLLSEATAANMRGGAQRATVYDPDDVARTTAKQTLLSEATAANLRGGAQRATVYDPDDVARTTARQTLLSEATAANLRGPALKSTVYDPDDVARTTGKEIDLHDTMGSSVMAPMVRRPRAAPDQDARTTGRQTLSAEDTVRNVGGREAKGMAYDPESWRPAVTMKQALVEERGGSPEQGQVDALQGRSAGAYITSEYEAKTVNRQYLADAGTAYGLAAGAASGGYEIGFDDDVRATQRQTTSDADYYGPTAESVKKPTSQGAVENATVSSSREVVAQGRDPTQVGSAAGADVQAIGSPQRQPQRSNMTSDDRAMETRVVEPGAAARPSGSTTRERNAYRQDDAQRLEDDVDGRAAMVRENPFAIDLAGRS
jgi:hypothetical protein